MGGRIPSEYAAYISEFLKEATGEGIDRDLYGLSEMIQWLWRTRIRKSESIQVVIPCKRMRELLERWLDGEFIREDGEASLAA
jgi:hypothetical protein